MRYCPRGGIGRRNGLKIRGAFMPLPVQVRPRAPYFYGYNYLMKIYSQTKSLKKFKQEFSPFTNKVNSMLNLFLKSDNKLINDITNHLILSGGKRIRPLIAIITGKSLGFDGDELFYLGCSVEMIHSATLLHDDVIDESNDRRGAKTANKIWDNKSAILVGDFIFAKSFEMMVRINNLEILNNLSKASSEIARGEIIQLENLKDKNFDINQYISIISTKTAILFAESSRNAAILARFNLDIQNNMYKFGYNLGIIFQILDDILDYFGDSKIFGKNIGDDFYEGKITLPIILLRKEMIKQNKDFSVIESLFEREARKSSDLKVVLDLMVEFSIRDKSEAIGIEYYKNGLQALSIIQDSKYKDNLREILDLSMNRIS